MALSFPTRRPSPVGSAVRADTRSCSMHSGIYTTSPCIKPACSYTQQTCRPICSTATSVSFRGNKGSNFTMSHSKAAAARLTVAAQQYKAYATTSTKSCKEASPAAPRRSATVSVVGMCAADQPAAPATTALVLGSGMAGLAAAQALSKHFDAVMVLEADAPNECWEGTAVQAAQVGKHPRPGVGQYNFLHTLLNRGADELEALCPGFLDTLLQKGAHKGGVFNTVRLGSPAGLFTTVDKPSQPIFYIHATRHLLEHTLRDFVQQNPNIIFRYNTHVTGLLFSDCSPSSSSSSISTLNLSGPNSQQQRPKPEDSDDTPAVPARRVVGVQLKGGQAVTADLVVVATGRGSKAAQWLAAEGWPGAPDSAVNINQGYTSWLLQAPPDLAASLPFTGIYHIPSPPNTPIGAYLQHVEDGAWVLATVHYNREYPKPTPEDTLKFLKEVMYNDEGYNIVSQSTALTPVRNIGGLNNAWTHYEQVLPPAGLLVLGDAYCHFNPVVAQGMTAAAVEAGLLHSTLQELLTPPQQTTIAATDQVITHSSSSSGDSGAAANCAKPFGISNNKRAAMAAAVASLNAKFYAAASHFVGIAWQLSANRDKLFPFAVLVNERKGLGWWLSQQYISGLFKVATFDAETCEAVHTTLNYMVDPTVLFKPSIVAKVVAHLATGWSWSGTKAVAAAQERQQIEQGTAESAVQAAAGQLPGKGPRVGAADM